MREDKRRAKKSRLKEKRVDAIVTNNMEEGGRSYRNRTREGVSNKTYE